MPPASGRNWQNQLYYISIRSRSQFKPHDFIPMNEQLQTTKSNFGTTPVFLTAISTILGAIMFLRFGFSVGSVGFAGSLIIILIGHAVTIPTALALGEIATNQKVEGGGEYFIISRSFGLNIGAAIGIALFLSQAISVAFIPSHLQNHLIRSSPGYQSISILRYWTIGCLAYLPWRVLYC